ncbi:Queuine tRNA-ribosyltransferase accessory subunit 2 [Frankliniella fusca]|uniref:Queuine tRNA-ribosyltransferase accessory subunit 2 n=1 Tax=Frankliniella fusca TaxID=407009 RepID=A0AAE1GR77_9NEOP|nr:Queuine tRNA-ribosyltransferase accessory subunit 2 [Frankliniella fusca]
MSKQRPVNGRDQFNRDRSQREHLNRDRDRDRASPGPRQKFACIEWLSESPDSIDFTHNVPLDWVRDYDPDEREESYVVEWRQGTMPRGGWHYYDGIIHEVSEDVEFLKVVMNNLKRDTNLKSTPRSQPHIDSPAVKDVLKQTPQRSREVREAKEKEIVHTQAEKVQVGKSLLLDKTSYNIARLASSPGRMVGICLRQAFSRRRLMKSSYAGQRRTKDGVTVTKPSLKKYQKTQDIHNFVLERFPHLTQSAFSSAVNSFLGEKPNQIRQISYVSESESEVDEDME